MKQLFTLLIFLSLLSCSNQNNLEGVWYFDFASDSYWDNDKPAQIIIRNDSILFNYIYFDHWSTFSASIQNGILKFKDYQVKYKIIDDTLVINENQKYTRILSGMSKEHHLAKSKIKIDLPRLDTTLFSSEKVKDDPYFKFLGRRHDTGEHSLMYNDNYISHEDLITVYDYGYHEKPYEYFFIDHNTKMRDLEFVLMDLMLKNQMRLIFVNHITISYNQKAGIHYKYQILHKQLRPFFNKEYLENHTYIKSLDIPYAFPPPPPPFESYTYPKVKIIQLKNGTITIDDIRADSSQLIQFVENCIEKNIPIVSIYDLDSRYSAFLDLTATIQSVYTDKRNKRAIEIYNTEFQNLERSKVLKIKEQIPMIHFWSYSIPHFNKIVKADGTLHGLKIDPYYLNKK